MAASTTPSNSVALSKKKLPVRVISVRLITVAASTTYLLGSLSWVA